MTVIAYRDGVLAADSLVSEPSGNITGKMDKIGRTGELRWGRCGDTGGSEKLFDWFFGGRAGEQPKPPDGGTLIVIYDQDGEIRIFTGGVDWAAPQADFHAWGSGADHARGAMKMGASAVQAVEAACELEVWCGPPIKVVE